MSYVRKAVPDKSAMSGIVDSQAATDSCTSTADDDEEIIHESAASIRLRSPYTQFFNNAVADVKMCTDDDNAELNTTYSPAAFGVIRDVMHLYPLWAAALHGSVRRFAYDADDAARDAELPKCRSNAVIESHFKSVKHGQKNRHKVRPRIFVNDRLRNVMAKVNATKVTFPHTRKRKANAKTDPASTCESWNRSPKKPRYSHKDVSVHVLQQLGAKLNSAKTERNHMDGSAGPSPLHVLDDTISTEIPVASSNSSEVNFKIDGSRSRKGIEDDDTLTPIPMRHSTPVVTALVPQELDDRIIQNIQDLLKQTHPDIGGLKVK